MANLYQIAHKVKNGETVYVIDDYEERAMWFSPQWRNYVYSKHKGSTKAYKRPLTDSIIIESVFSGKEVSKEEYENY